MNTSWIPAVRKFIGTDLITGSDRNGPIFFLLSADFVRYFDTIHIFKLIPGPHSDVYIFPKLLTP